MAKNLAGIYAAALTPLHADLTIDHEGLLSLLDFIAKRGAHGALIFGTTGEGPSFSTEEKLSVFQTCKKIRNTHPDFHLLAGTTSPSIYETQTATKWAFDFGFDGVVLLPPYYFRNASDEGLFQWFSTVLQTVVPADGAVFGYHIPKVSGVSLSTDLISRLKDNFPNKFVGLKDSSANLGHAKVLGERFGADLTIFNGTDRLLSQALQFGATGAITALANFTSPYLRAVWDAHQAGKTDEEAQLKATQARDILEKYMPAPPLLKHFAHSFYDFPSWGVKPPLMSISEDVSVLANEDWGKFSNDSSA